MSHGSRRTVSPQSPWRLSGRVYVAVFLASGAAVGGWNHWERYSAAGRQLVQATATVYVANDSAHRPMVGPNEDPLRSKLEGIAQRLVSRAGRQETVGFDLRPTPNQGDWRVAFSASDRSPQRVAATADELAQDFRQAYLGQWRREAQQDHAAWETSAQRANDQLRQAQSRLESEKDQLAQRRRQAASQAVSAPSAPSLPARTENPAWTDLKREIGQLEQRHRNLLLDRTPLHPAVQEVANRLESLHGQLAATPQWNAPEPRPNASATPPAVVEGPNLVIEDRAVQEAVAETVRLEAEVEAARRTLGEATAAERLAAESLKREPSVRVEGAVVPEVVPDAPRSLTAAFMAALATGLTTVTGLAMIASGAAMELPLRSPAAVHQAVSVPIVGLVPDEGQLGRSTGSNRSSRPLRLALIAGGILVLMACVAMVLLMPPA